MRIFISSPYKGDVEANMRMASGIAATILAEGHIPVVPHWAHHWLEWEVNDDKLRDDFAMILCESDIDTVDEVWSFGAPTDGMIQEQNYARRIGKKVVPRG